MINYNSLIAALSFDKVPTENTAYSYYSLLMKLKSSIPTLRVEKQCEDYVIIGLHN